MEAGSNERERDGGMERWEGVLADPAATVSSLPAAAMAAGVNEREEGQ